MTPNPKLVNLVKKHEGFRSKLYTDSRGIYTIGYGRNLQDEGVSELEASILLTNDLVQCQFQLSEYPWFAIQPEAVQFALIDMCYNMGLSKLLGFKNMITALKTKNLSLASTEALDSDWAEEVKSRALDDANLIKSGI